MPAFSTPDEILKFLSANKTFDDQWAIQFLATFLRDIKVFVVSKGISAKTAEILRVRLFNSADEAVNEAIKLAGSNYRLAIIENPDILIVNLA
jgi:hypothetical protein